MKKLFIENHLIGTGLSSELIPDFIDIAKYRTVARNEVILEKGTISESIYYVIDGAFIYRYTDALNNNPKTVNFYLSTFQPIMSAIKSYFDKVPSDGYLMAITSSKILELKREDLERLKTTNSRIYNYNLKQLITALLAENEFRIKQITLTKTEFYNYILETYPQIIQQVPSKYIAEFIGITQEWLSKLKHRI